MNNTLLTVVNQNATKAKFRGKKTLKCRTIPRYPASAEREYRRVTAAYVRLIRDELKANLPAIMEEYKKEQRKDSRFDASYDLMRSLQQMFSKISKKLEQKFIKFGLEQRTRAVAEMTKATSLREWKRAVRNTLGIDLMDDYYSSAFYEQYLQKWVDDNVNLIKSIPNPMLDEMREIIEDGFLNGKTAREIQREIQREYDMTKSRAQLIARDQIATLNAEITQAQQRDAGITEYYWSSSKDIRVRECHAELDGNKFSWDDPPEMWYETKSKGRVYTGRFCHPGEDIYCRCVAIPVFAYETLNMPIKGAEDENEVQQ